MAADSVYGVGEIELALRRAYKGYVLGVTGQHRFWSWDGELDVAGTAEEIAKGIPDQTGCASRPEPAPRDRACTTGPTCELADAPGGCARRRARSEPVDARPAGPAQPVGRGARLLHDLVPGRHAGRGAGGGRGPALGDRGRVRDRQDRAWAGPQRDPLAGTAGIGTSALVMLAFAMLARVRRLANGPPQKRCSSPSSPAAVVDPGDPARRDAAGAAAHRASPRDRLVSLATRPPSYRSAGASQKKDATVMLGLLTLTSLARKTASHRDLADG